MKGSRSIKLIILGILFLIPLKVNAGSVSVALSCPSSANAGAIIACSISATPTDTNITGIQVNYDISNGTFSSFTPSSGWTSYANSANGFLMGRSSISSTVSVGTLKIKMPSSGNMTISLSNIQLSNTSDETIYASNRSSTIRVRSTTNTLSALSLSNGTLSPGFSSGTTSYSATINASSVVISATKTDSKSSISGVGTRYLNYGKNTLNVVVTSESGSQRTYTIVVTRVDNRKSINNLSSLSINQGTLSPGFSSGNTSYKVEVASNVSSIAITAKLADSSSEFVNGYGPRTVNLNYGSNTIQVKVVAENDSVKTYTIVVNRKDDRSNDNTLKSLTINDGNVNFDSEIYEYKTTVAYNVNEIEVTALSNDEKAKVEVTGNRNLSVGTNKITIKITAENQTIKTYTIVVTKLKEGERIPSSDSNIKSLTINGKHIKLSDSTDYVINIEKELESLKIDVKLSSEFAKYEIENNKDIIDGRSVKLRIIAEDGSSKLYTLSCNMQKSYLLNYILVSLITAAVVETINIIIFMPKKKKRKLNRD